MPRAGLGWDRLGWDRLGWEQGGLGGALLPAAAPDPPAVNDMSCRIDDLERNIADLMMQAGVEELEGENKTPASNKG